MMLSTAFSFPLASHTSQRAYNYPLNLKYSTYYTFEFQSRYIASMYALSPSGDVRGFLARHQFLVPLLYKTFFQIKQYFPDSTLRLGFDTLDEDERGLVATIITAMTPAAAFQTLQQFDDEWWLDAAYGSQMQLSIDLEFRHR